MENEELLEKWANRIDYELAVRNYDAMKYQLRLFLREVDEYYSNLLLAEYDRGVSDGISVGSGNYKNPQE